MTLYSRLAAVAAKLNPSAALAGLLPAALVAAVLLPSAALAHEGLHLKDPFARTTPQSGAVYLLIENHADKDDQLLAASSPAAAMVMPMTTEAKADGTMAMVNQPDGFTIPAGGSFLLEPGHAHLMLMGLTAPLKTGDTITLTLTFANSGDVTLTVPVNSARISAPTDTDTPYDAETENDGQTHAAMDMGAMQMGSAEPAHDGPMSMDSVVGTPDQQAIITLMKAQFDKPEAPLAVDPVVVMGDDAVASWAQGDMAGRALLRRTGDAWAIVLCAGADLRDPAFLSQHGVADAAMLSQMFNQAEDGLGADKVTLYSGFQGVVDMSHGSN